MDAARQQGPALRELHGQTESIEFKSDKSDIVTEADYKSENIITTVLESDSPITESDPKRMSNGTARASTHGQSIPSTVPVISRTGTQTTPFRSRCSKNEPPSWGRIRAETDEMFSAISGEEAMLNGTPLTTTERTSLDECMLLSGYDPDGTFLSHSYHEARAFVGSALLH